MTRSRPSESEPGRAAAFLRRLERGLRSLPRPVRAAACAEIEAHLAERAARGELAAALAALGDPDALARALRDVHAREGVDALAGRLQAAAVAGERRLRVLGAGSAAALLSLVAAVFVLVAATKPAAPAHVGLWSGRDGFAFGLLSNPGPLAQERLGVWIMPVALAAALAGGWAAAALWRGLRAGRGRTLDTRAA